VPRVVSEDNVPTEAQVLARLRPLCLALPEARETVTFGHPTFQAGKRTFAVLETYRGELSLALKASPDVAHALLDDPRFYPTPYSGKHSWVSMRVGRGPLDWKEIRALVVQSYRQVALVRMLRALGDATKAILCAVGLALTAAAARADGPPPGAAPATPPTSIHQIDAATAGARGSDRAPGSTPAAPAPPGALAPRVAAPFKQVHGFHPYWMGSSWQSYDWALLSTVAFFGIELDAGGGIATAHGWPPAGLVSAAHAHGVRVVVTAILFDSSALQTLLASATNRAAAVATITAAAVQGGADGACIDFEGVPGARKADFVTFVGQLQTALQAALPQAYLSVCTPAVDWGNAYDYDQIAARCDHLMIMAYDYHWANSSSTGPVSPLGGWGTYNVGWTIQDYITWGAPRERMLLGVPYYGYRWPAASGAAGATTTGTATALTYNAAAAEAATHGSMWDATSQTPWLRYQNPGWLQTWYDDDVSLAAKYDRVWTDELAGVGVWALGYDGSRPELWTALRLAFGSRVADAGATQSLPQIAVSATNPFLDRVAVELRAASTSNVRLDVYSIDGRRVRAVWQGVVDRTEWVVWDGRDDCGHVVAAGVYVLAATSEEARVARRIVRLRGD
jgi:predicted DNA-binding protein (MmcQ/YjbR family)